MFQIHYDFKVVWKYSAFPWLSMVLLLSTLFQYFVQLISQLFNIWSIYDLNNIKYIVVLLGLSKPPLLLGNSYWFSFNIVLHWTQLRNVTTFLYKTRYIVHYILCTGKVKGGWNHLTLLLLSLLSSNMYIVLSHSRSKLLPEIIQPHMCLLALSSNV